MKGIFLTLVVVLAGFFIWKKFLGPKLAAAGFGFSDED